MDDGGSAHSSPLGNLTAEEVTSKIILTAIIVLFMAVLFVLLLHLYAKLYWWRVDQQQQEQQQQLQQQQQQQPSHAPPPPPTRRHRRRFIFVPGQDALRNSGLSHSVLSSLPVVVFRPEDYKDGIECAVCLSELVDGDKARLLPKCNHSFHVDCIDMWFQSHSTCPICRNTVLGPEEASSKRAEPVSDNVAAVSINNHDTQSQNSNSASGSPESPNFPTNVLVWGSQNQVSTGINNVASFEDGSANVTSTRAQESVAVEINDDAANVNTSQNVSSSSSSSSSSSMRFLVEEEEQPKSPMTTRLRSLKRFLSRDKRVACSSSVGSSSSNASADA